MKRKLLLFFTVVIFFSGVLYSQDRGLGLGIILGEPTGISVKSWTGSTTAFQGAVAWSFTNTGALHIHADYIFHDFHLLEIDGAGKLPVYYGIGARVKFRTDDTRLGVRVPLGIGYLLQTAPVDFFFEIVPILNLIPSSSFTINAAIGARYFFY